MLKSKVLLSIAGAMSLLVVAGTAQAAPASGLLDTLRTAGQQAGSQMESVHWRRHRNCHWHRSCWYHRGHRHCRWVRRCHRW